MTYPTLPPMNSEVTPKIMPSSFEDEMLSLSERDFEFLRKMIHKNTGIAIDESKRILLQGRLALRIKELNISNIKSYLTLLRSCPDSEMEHLANAITTNTTSFLRHDYQFEFLASFLKQKERDIRKKGFKIWSAACSTGQEAYSIAWIASRSLPMDAAGKVKILATDIDGNAVETALSGVYPEAMIAELPSNYIHEAFLHGIGQHSGMVKVKPHLHNMIKFRRLNLIDQWPFDNHFQIIFCRNVCIYFDKDTQIKLFQRFSKLQEAGDYLFTGRAEHIPDECTQYKLVGKSTYQRI